MRLATDILRQGRLTNCASAGDLACPKLVATTGMRTNQREQDRAVWTKFAAICYQPVTEIAKRESVEYGSSSAANAGQVATLNR